MTSEVADSSVVIPAIASWHEVHVHARQRVGKINIAIGHSLSETYSTLTRMPIRVRHLPELVIAYFERQFVHEIPLPPYLESIKELQRCGVAGGATYDGLIALTARNVGMKLLSLDRRAIPTYEAVGVEYEILN